jgi:hypothetical protein
MADSAYLLSPITCLFCGLGVAVAAESPRCHVFVMNER